MAERYDYKFRLVLCGDSRVGKTSLFDRYINDTFSPTGRSTIGNDFQVETVNKDGKNIRLQLWDTVGFYRYKHIPAQAFHRSDGFLIVFDVTDRKSFLRIPEWLEEFKILGAECKALMLIGNKTDMTQGRVIDFAEAKEYADSLGLTYIETSAKLGTNFDLAINSMVDTLVGMVPEKKKETCNYL